MTTSDTPEYVVRQALGGEGSAPTSADLTNIALSTEALEMHRRIRLWRSTLQGYLRSSTAILKHNGITTGEYCGLLEIWSSKSDAGPTIGELARLLRLGHPSIVSLVNRLCEKGLVKRVPSDRDRRAVNVSLTDRGRELLSRLVQDHKRELDEITSNLRKVVD